MAENETPLALTARLEAAAKNTSEVWQGNATPDAVLRLCAELRRAVETCRYVRRWLAETLLDEEVHQSIPRKLDNVLRGWEKTDG